MPAYIHLHIAQAVKRVWDRWNIRGAILFSLWLQVLLILVAPLRKSARGKFNIILIWFAYLLADAAANFAVGLISNSQRNQYDEAGQKVNQTPEENSDMLAFWAPFLLLHLGGPDTITAFALEDNELWPRHFLGLGFQAVAVVYVFIQSLPNKNLWVPTLLMLVAGMIKYGERTFALYKASLDKFRDSMLEAPDAGPNYAKLMEEYDFKKNNRLPTQISLALEPDKEAKASDIPPKTDRLKDLEVVHYAYKYFKIFKGLVVDLIFSFRERDESRDFFKRRDPEDALRVIEVELNFLYGTLYTKEEILHGKFKVGCILRFLALACVLASLGIFYFKVNKHEFRGVDIGITYTLLLGAIALDVIAIFMFIFSDRTIASSIKDPERPPFWAPIYEAFLVLMTPWWKTCTCEYKHELIATPLVVRRWSGSISSHNLIRYCLEGNRKSIHEFPSWWQMMFESILRFLKLNKCFNKCATCICKVIGLLSPIRKFLGEIVWSSFGKIFTYFAEDFMDEMVYVSLEPFSLDLWKFIFEELRTKSEFADTPESAKRISSARGEWALTDACEAEERGKLLRYLIEVPYDQSILLWHIATDLCYYHNEMEELTQFSKTLSDYMLYLLVFRPTMMSAVAGIGKIRFRDTCAEAKRFFKIEDLYGNKDKEACKKLLEVRTDVGPQEVKGDRSKSVLFDACMLAKELNKMDDKWKIMSKVWVELVSYAASHCRASTHAADVSQGGELITFFWLLMAHFGLGEQFQINEGHARAKLMVGK
ncbi:1-phosphatidylinositol 4,5-bisphosphate phosphodiesterase beta-1 [Gossypium australe]|uniref:1-phosphatidylinositol 4,5-bisphosphate phosphodiesterase beta-1 n=1 Tax=Gossypium australe TaxID=47621 RepID=A0A5B6UZG6_9ROSI|nr:1-phosphatidylinositol 4,5-bisphosphate phosphodiesterase beta-1 [Gossypium australe]